MGQAGSGDSYAVVVAVGPDPREVDRVQDLAASIAFHEPRGGVLVLVDDHPEPRGLERNLPLPDTIRAVSLHHRRPEHRDFQRSKGICSVIQLGLQWAQANTTAAFVLKLDTDSLVIGPYRERLLTAFRSDRSLGMVGAYETDLLGRLRDWSMHHESLDLLSRRILWRRPRYTLRTWNDPLKARVRDLRQAAERHGYRSCEHCLGGGYAVSRGALDAMAAAGHLRDPMLWAGVDLPEDVMVGLHTRAVGFTLADMVDVGEVFGVAYVGLAHRPPDLLARGYAVIHAVKNDPELSEDDIRSFFRDHRGTLAHGPQR